ncbi:beta-ketoacyl synthase N-terminal-like domain-containing protein [Clostridium sp. LP20]|uniref:beta-ketoacyl synthase N-terminal-like domain-containing protein n=1 Tax=Clostridium sp. LP20 TaxID=3418665 RepID=UPI003EE66C30
MREALNYILEGAKKGNIPKEDALEVVSRLKNSYKDENDDIAIIGISVRMPNSKNVNKFWDNIINGVESIEEFPESRKRDINRYLNFKNTDTSKVAFSRGGYLDEIDKFDYDFFKITPIESSLMDPNQRIFLETAYEAIEDSGYGGEKILGSNTGLYLGYSRDLLFNYSSIIADMNPESLSLAAAGNIPSIIASRLSYVLDLKGPGVIIDTACSSSLVATHIACNALRNGECDMAIAGGIKLNLLPLVNSTGIGIESPEFRTKAFDNDADGTALGEGSVAIILKPLSKALRDKDNIYSVIKGSAINQDGTTVGITAPNVNAQRDVILEAWKNAKINPEEISFIEVHGTGTRLGDPIEIEGISNAFKRYTDKKQFCSISSVKTNVGHLFETSGAISLVKAILELRHRKLVPSINFNFPNSNIEFESSPVYLNDRVIDLKQEPKPLICGVSSFGISGVNCHMILEEFIQKESSYNVVNNNKVLTISAKSKKAFEELIKEYKEFVSSVNEDKLDDSATRCNMKSIA